MTRLLLVSGSLRASSTNTALLRTACAIAPPGLTTVLYEGLGVLPAYNPDVDTDPLPPAVASLRGEIHASGAVLLSTPEYAGTLPGAFKNLLDWTIGDDQPGSIYDKPVAWIDASPRGAAGAEATLRTVLGYAHATIVDEACAAIAVTTAMIGSDGLIADAGVRRELTGVLERLR